MSLTDRQTIEFLITKEMTNLIDQVLNGEEKSVNIPRVRPAEVIEHIESLGGKDNHDLNINGWQWDYWTTVNINDKKYIISGDGFYGTGTAFSLDGY